MSELNRSRDKANGIAESNDSDAQSSRAYLAALFGLREVIEHLHSKDGDIINRIGGLFGTPIQAACRGGHNEQVLRLAELGAEVKRAHRSQGTLLAAAAMTGNLVVCDLALKHGVDIRLGDDEGMTPLHLAAGFGHEEIVLRLLDAGADILEKSSHGYNAFCSAAVGDRPL